jgi:hypothetical protein
LGDGKHDEYDGYYEIRWMQKNTIILAKTPRAVRASVLNAR